MEKKRYFVSYNFLGNNNNEVGFGSIELIDITIFSIESVTKAIKEKYNFKKVVIISFQEFKDNESWN